MIKLVINKCKISKGDLGVDWTQRSTIRGAVWAIGSAIATTYLFVNKDPIGFSTIMGATGMAVGGLGVVVKD